VGGGRYGTARVAILTIVDAEFDAVRAALGGVQQVLEIEDSSYYSPATDRSGDPDLVLAQADRSHLPAMGAGRDLLEVFRPEFVLVCGIAGGIAERDGVDLGHVVIADYLHYAEFRKLDAGSDLPRYYAYDQPSAGVVSGHCRPHCRDLNLERSTALEPPDRGENHAWPPHVHYGPVISSEKLLGDPSHPAQQHAAGRFDNALAVDMESVGVARAVHEERNDVTYNPRLAVIRGISDIVHPKPLPDGTAGPNPVGEAGENSQVQENQRQRAQWRPYAAATAATVACGLAERLLRQPDPRAALRNVGEY
jgi:nucleoside phosphorylase